jgi:hypothetical protein
MSYDPSHRTPPRQERWPQATPAEGWPPYRDGEEERASRQDARAQQAAGSHRRPAAPRSGVATAVFPVTGDAHGTPDSYGTDGYRTGGYPDGYTGGTDGFDGAPGGYTRADLAHGQAASAPAADADGWARLGYAGIADGYGTAEYGYARTGNGYSGTKDGYPGVQHGYDQAGNGYAGAANGYDSAPDGYPSGGAYLGPGSYIETTYSGSGYQGSGYSDAGYSGPGYSEPGYSDSGYSDSGYSEPGYSDSGYSDSGYSDSGYSEPGYSEPGYSEPGYSEPGYSDSGYSEPGYFGSGYSDSTLTAPDAGIYPEGWQADQARRRAARYRGLLVSAATEFLATAVVIGVTTLAAGLLRSTVSPVSAMGTIFIDRTPAVLRGFALHHFGTHGRTVLLLGMYAVIAVIAIAIGVAARRAAAFGVTGVAAFTLVTAFAAVTRPAGQVSDVMPAVIGGLAGVAALLWLVRASAPVQEVTPLRPARGGTRRRTR